MLGLALAAADAAPSAPQNLLANLTGSNLVRLSWGVATGMVAVSGYQVERCQGANCTGFAQVASLPAAGISGPLTVSAVNPRYFAAPSGRTLLLGGSHHWLNFIDSGTNSPPPAFDYDAYLDFLCTNHHNFFRLWAQELPKMNYNAQDAGPWYQSPQPWLRTGPSNATDGLPRFDLSRFNQSYFDRLRQRVQKANARGIYVSVMLFEGFHLQFDRRADDGFPLSGANNVNGVADGGGTASQDLSAIPASVLAVEESYVRKVLDTVNDLPNVLYEVANEAGAYSTAWQQHFIALVKGYEVGKPWQHPVGFTYQYSSGSDSTLYTSDAHWVSPSEQFPANDGTRHVLQNDTDHSYSWPGMKSDGPQLNRAFVWVNFTAGNSALFMDPYLMPWTASGTVRNSPSNCAAGPNCTGPDSRWNAIRRNIGYMLDYANGRLDLASVAPHGALASTGCCLANAAPTNAEYLVYAASGGSCTVNLSATTRPLAVEWLNPATGAMVPGGMTNGGSAAQAFLPPFTGDAVLYLVDAARQLPSVPVEFTETDLAPTTRYSYRVRAWDAAGNLGPYSNLAVVFTPGPPRIDSVALNPQGATQVTVSSPAGSSIALQASSDLLAWVQVDQQTNSSGSVVLSEPTATNAARFYRAVSISGP